MSENSQNWLRFWYFCGIFVVTFYKRREAVADPKTEGSGESKTREEG